MNRAWCLKAVFNLLIALVPLPLARAAESVAKPAPPPTETNRLIEKLGDKNYFVRQRAEDQLARQGFDAFDALTAATSNPDLEIATRARRLLLLVKVRWIDKEAPQEARRLLSDYENQSEDGRRTKMTQLAQLPQDGGFTALCWLIRYEKSTLLSKEAAILLLSTHDNSEGPSAEIAAGARKILGECRRPGAQWIDTWLRTAGDPKLVGETWTRLVDAEAALLPRGPRQTAPQIVAGLLRFQATKLKKLGRDREAETAATRLVELERGDADSLYRLGYWLATEKYWQPIVKLAERFPKPMGDYPILQYFVAEAHARLGDKTQAEAVALRAFQLHPSKSADELLQHLRSAIHLQQRGLFDWSKREYRHYIDAGQPSEETNARARYTFAEMLHDLGEELPAAEALRPVSDAIGPSLSSDMAFGDRTVGDIRSRMNYFYACHWNNQGDAAKYRKYLDEALAANEGDVDVLIACYRLADAGDEYHKKIVKLVKKEAARLRDDHSTRSRTEYNCNQYAWLVGNTEGDLDEALVCAKKAVELQPDAGGYYDTLARVYYARGDYAAAVQNQSKALELDPYSGQIGRQLLFFKKRLAEEKAKGKPPAT